MEYLPEIREVFIRQNGPSGSHIREYDHWITHHVEDNICSPTVPFPNGDILKIANLRIEPPT